jgi:hypothetical protein
MLLFKMLVKTRTETTCMQTRSSDPGLRTMIRVAIIDRHLISLGCSTEQWRAKDREARASARLKDFFPLVSR